VLLLRSLTAGAVAVAAQLLWCTVVTIGPLVVDRTFLAHGSSCHVVQQLDVRTAFAFAQSIPMHPPNMLLFVPSGCLLLLQPAPTSPSQSTLT
jgi:hypothetical protein